MKKFKYSLENVLKYKKDTEDSIKENYLKLKIRIDEEQGILESLSFQLQNNISGITGKRNSNAMNFKNSYLYIYTLQEKIENQDKVINEYKLELDEIRNKLIIAQKERKTIELLKEKAYENHLKEMEKEEQKLIDELGLYAHLRKGKI
ncbi:flagellar export protein FliJ [Clostridium sediminicola]|uniref:flagellar export protein FliJ n=1 Tax=Clostridium sediminicola TaxID=3114879 RepID=UPI0031F1CDA6